MQNFAQIRTRLRETFQSGRTRPIEYRQCQLYALYQCLSENEDAFLDAMEADGKNRSEAKISDLMTLIKEIVHVQSNLAQWMQPRSVGLDLAFRLALDSGEIVYEPLGTVLVIGTWNYSLATSLGPLIGAMAAGNTALIKLSEVAENATKAMLSILPKYLDTDSYHFVTGAVPEITAILKLQWDHIFFTGNCNVGRVIARAAAEHLTPCTLELGGKSPAFIDDSIDLKTAVQRIVAGKFFNNGQTCVAPDYILLPKHLQEPFVEVMRQTLNEFYGPEEQLTQSKDYARIINENHWKRLTGVLAKTKGKIVIGGQSDQAQRYIAPTVVQDVQWDDALMKDELFGPILPIITCESIDDVIAEVTKRDKPLAAYLFSRDTVSIDKFKAGISSGGMVINDSIIHFAVSSLPFGGVGSSGYGSYHGRAGFEQFSHKKSVLWRSALLELPNQLRYPPYSEQKFAYLKMLTMGTPSRPQSLKEASREK